MIHQAPPLVPDAVIPLFSVMLHNKGNVLYPCLHRILICARFRVDLFESLLIPFHVSLLAV